MLEWKWPRTATIFLHQRIYIYIRGGGAEQAVSRSVGVFPNHHETHFGPLVSGWSGGPMCVESGCLLPVYALWLNRVSVPSAYSRLRSLPCHRNVNEYENRLWPFNHFILDLQGFNFKLNKRAPLTQHTQLGVDDCMCTTDIHSIVLCAQHWTQD